MIEIPQNIIQFVEKLYDNDTAKTLKLLAGGGSSRQYYRFRSADKSYVLTYSENVEENKTFIYLAQHFTKIVTNLPRIQALSEDETMYVQDDLGDVSMLDKVQVDKQNSFQLYQKAIQQLVKLQILGDENLDYDQCFSYPKFNYLLVLRDLFLFKNYFLNRLDISINQGELLKDFEQFAKDFEQIQLQYFVYRDFQTRNIMLVGEEPYFIDFQGGLKGPIQYDLVSLIWQAKVNLSTDWKQQLYDFYLSEVETVLGHRVDRKVFRLGYELCLIERLLQVLGAYGLRGLIEGKKHFIDSISYGIDNLRVIQNLPTLQKYPTLQSMISKIVEPTTLDKIKKMIYERETKC